MTDHLRPEWVAASGYPDGYLPGDSVPDDAVDAPPPFQIGDRARLSDARHGLLTGTVTEIVAVPRSRLGPDRKLIRTHAINWCVHWQPDDNPVLRSIFTTADRLMPTDQPSLF